MHCAARNTAPNDTHDELNVVGDGACERTSASALAALTLDLRLECMLSADVSLSRRHFMVYRL